MKKSFQIAIFSTFLSIFGYSQTYHGQIIEITGNKDEIKIPQIKYGTILIETELEKIQWSEKGSIIPLETRVHQNGQFSIDVSALKGKAVTMYFSCDDYAHIVLRDIPIDSLQQYITVLPTIKNQWKPTCGHDCFTVDKRRTYKRSTISINKGSEILVFHRKIEEVETNAEKGWLLPVPFLDTWPADKVYYYQYQYN